jgi:hypothetical protein
MEVKFRLVHLHIVPAAHRLMRARRNDGERASRFFTKKPPSRESGRPRHDVSGHAIANVQFLHAGLHRFEILSLTDINAQACMSPFEIASLTAANSRPAEEHKLLCPGIFIDRETV